MDRGERSSKGEPEERLAALRGEFVALLQGSDRRGARRMLHRAVATGIDPGVILREVVIAAVDEVGGDWKEHEVSLSQVYATGLIVEDSLEILPCSECAGEGTPATVVLGTANGEFHGLGKRIVRAFLRAAGFVVVDLGLSVPAEAFVEAALLHGAHVIAVSALMADTALGVREVREAMEREKVDGVKLLVGGAPFRFNPELYRVVGADATAPNAYEAARVARALLGETP